MSLSLKNKIYASVFFIFVLIFIGSFFSVMTTKKVEKGIEHSSLRFKQLSTFLEFKYNLTHMTLQYMDAIVDASSGTVDADIKTGHDNFIKYIEDNRQFFIESVDTKEEKENLDKILQNIKTYLAAGDGLLKAISQKLGQQEMDKYDDVIDELSDSTLKLFQQTVDSISKDYDESGKALIFMSENSINVLYLTAGLTLLFIVFGGLFFASYLVGHMSSIAELLVVEIEKFEASSNKLDHLSQSLTAIATDQAASVQQTSSSINEITSMVSRNSETTKSSQTETEFSITKIKEGERTIDEMKKVIHDISSNNEKIVGEAQRNNDEINKIVNMIKEIETKTSVINDIVFQTKLLSFNASVEAARAGESGKGFAVVAEEVGNLAQMSGSAATEISELLNTSMAKVVDIAKNFEAKISTIADEGKVSMESGGKVAKNCEVVFSAISTSVNSVLTKVREISSASEEQARGTQEISNAVSLINTGSQEISHLANSSRKNAGQLSQGAKDLSAVVDTLQKMIRGKKNSSPNDFEQFNTEDSADSNEEANSDYAA